MTDFFVRFRENWKENYAVILVYGYAYNFAWPWIFWMTTLLTLWTDKQWPAPPLLPWEQLTAATGTLAVIGTVQIFKNKQRGSSDESSTEVRTTTKTTDRE